MSIESNNHDPLRVFISYKWDDTKAIVRGIADDLKKTENYEVWIDKEEMFGNINQSMEEVCRTM